MTINISIPKTTIEAQLKPRIIVVGVVLFFALQYLPNDAVRAALEQSSVATFLIATMTALQVLFPESVRITK